MNDTQNNIERPSKILEMIRTRSCKLVAEPHILGAFFDFKVPTNYNSIDFYLTYLEISYYVMKVLCQMVCLRLSYETIL